MSSSEIEKYNNLKKDVYRLFIEKYYSKNQEINEDEQQKINNNNNNI